MSIPEFAMGISLCTGHNEHMDNNAAKHLSVCVVLGGSTIEGCLGVFD